MRYNEQAMKVLATNRRAKFDYDITDTLVTGVVLNGAEVKSVKQGAISLKGSYVTINRGELYVLNAHVSHYKHAGIQESDETRTRKLLVHKKELAKLVQAKQNGLAIVPLKVGVERGLIKIEIGIGRGRKKFDKRGLIKQREAARNIDRAKR